MFFNILLRLIPNETTLRKFLSRKSDVSSKFNLPGIFDSNLHSASFVRRYSWEKLWWMHKVCCFQFNPWKPFSDLLLHEAKTSKRWDPHSDTYLACFAKIKSEYTRPATLGRRNSWQNLAIYMYVHSKNRWKYFHFYLNQIPKWLAVYHFTKEHNLTFL